MEEFRPSESYRIHREQLCRKDSKGGIDEGNNERGNNKYKL